MQGSSFLNSFMPTLPWWFLVLALTALGTGATVNRVRLWNAQRHRIEHSRKVLAGARDALASTISDPLAGEGTRKQAVDAYEAITEAIKNQESNT
jgi:hypothetical protein